MRDFGGYNGRTSTAVFYVSIANKTLTTSLVVVEIIEVEVGFYSFALSSSANAACCAYVGFNIDGMISLMRPSFLS